MNIKELSDKAESEQDLYANTPPSGRGVGDINIQLKDITPYIKPISIRKPFAMIVGSVATQDKSNNDIDIVVRGEDLSDKVKDAINFRIYRMFSEILHCSYDDTPKYVHIHYNNAGSYTSYIPLYELNLIPMSPDKIAMSKIPFILEGKIEIINKSSDESGDRIIAGYANVAIVDDDEQFIPVETLKSGIETLLKDQYYSNLMLMHGNIQIGRIIPSFKDYTTHVDDKGFFIVCKIRNDLKIANKAWDMMLNGEIKGFSIGCEVIDNHKQCDDDKCVTILDKINIFEVSICSNPINEESGFKIISKSKVGKEYLDCMCRCNEISGENMSVKKHEEPLPVPTPVKEEVKAEEKPKEQPTPTPPTPNPTPEPPKPEEQCMSLEEQLKALDAKLQELGNILAELAKKPKPEEVPPEAPKPEEPAKEPPKETNPYPLPSQYPYPDNKAEFESLKKSMDTIIEKLNKLSDNETIKTEIKARDDMINALNLKIDTINKSKDAEPKTLQEPTTTTKKVEEESNLVIKKGMIYHK